MKTHLGILIGCALLASACTHAGNEAGAASAANATNATCAPSGGNDTSAEAHAAALKRGADAETAAGVESKYATVNGVKLHYLTAGKGPPVILLHGYGDTSHMWLPLFAQLAKTNTIIAPDLRGSGRSEKADGGYEKKKMAQDIHALSVSLGLTKPRIVGHDIGLMVAYAYAAQFPDEITSVVLMDAFLPGVGEWKGIWLTVDFWHFHFYGETPLKLVAGRERTYLDHFWNDFAADKTKSLSEADRALYAAGYAQPKAMYAGFEWFRAFPQDAVDNAAYATKKLPMPMLVIAGEKASGQSLIDQGRMVATNVKGVIIKGSGHWLMEEATEPTVAALVDFLAPKAGTP